MLSSYQALSNWKEQDAQTRTPKWKQIFYDGARPWLSLWMRPSLSASTLKAYKPSRVLPERGFPLEARRRWATNDRSLHGKTILVQGTGTGWDVISWAELKPARIIATDLFAFDDSWDEISDHCRQELGVNVEFHQAPLENHSFLKDCSIDLCASDAVYEHCKDLSAVTQETRRVLKPAGCVYASYGPLWFCASGDHFDRGGLECAYNHLLLDNGAYQEYIDSYREEREDMQSGSRYFELGLFSYLTTSEYLEIFRSDGFVLDDLILEVSSQAMKFRKRFPERFEKLEKRYAGHCKPDDFLIKANFVRLKKQ
jgi:SAM-dependent methyltransferase